MLIKVMLICQQKYTSILLSRESLNYFKKYAQLLILGEYALIKDELK